MTAHVLDNPIWASLTSRHRALALRHGEVLRYPADIAPFLGVPRGAMDAATALDALVPSGDTVLLLGPTPKVPVGWRLQGPTLLAQMVCPEPVAAMDSSDIIELGLVHGDDVLALTALVYPHYFRARTMALGRYFGIYCDGQLAAIIGERMGMDDWQEISAVCTHPDHVGRGHARRLLAHLGNDNLRHGRTPFLHVSHDNLRAKSLYERAGYVHRCDIPFWSLQRDG